MNYEKSNLNTYSRRRNIKEIISDKVNKMYRFQTGNITIKGGIDYKKIYQI